MIIDFHCHSNASDGSLAPTELVRRAVDAGVSHFAITDHDTVAGYRSVLADPGELPEGFTLLAGVELSCQWSGVTIHVLGIDVDIDHPELLEGLERLATARVERAGAIAQCLEKRGMPGALEGALQLAGESQVGRPHFARWMVAEGHVKDANQAFDKFLGAGKPGDIKAFWPELAEVTAWLAGAGGTAVLAHPGKYKMTRTKLRALVRDFREAGGRGLEVVCGRQPREQSLQLCKMATEFDLLISAGSDFHRFWNYGPQLGVNVSKLPRQPALWTEGGRLSQFFQIHPDNPQARLVRQAVDIIRQGGVVAYPTDSAYALGCHIGDKSALDRIRRIRRLDEKHNFTLMCRDLSELASYARVDNAAYRLLRHNTPGPYTFILQATSEVPRRLQHPKRKTIGLRVPDNNVALALLEDLGEPLMSVTLIMPGDEYPLTDPYDIRETLQHEVDAVVDGGYCGMEPTTVIDLHEGTPVIVREGKGDPEPFVTG